MMIAISPATRLSVILSQNEVLVENAYSCFMPGARCKDTPCLLEPIFSSVLVQADIEENTLPKRLPKLQRRHSVTFKVNCSRGRWIRGAILETLFILNKDMASLLSPCSTQLTVYRRALRYVMERCAFPRRKR